MNQHTIPTRKIDPTRTRPDGSPDGKAKSVMNRPTESLWSRRPQPTHPSLNDQEFDILKDLSLYKY